jgi:hypothetical protein
VALAALLLAGGGLWWWLASRAASAAPSYTTQTVARGNLTLSVTANGTLQPTRSISIGSELSGTVLKVNVDVNDRIRRARCWWCWTPPSCATRSCARRPPVASAKAKWRRPPPR